VEASRLHQERQIELRKEVLVSSRRQRTGTGSGARVKQNSPTRYQATPPAATANATFVSTAGSPWVTVVVIVIDLRSSVYWASVVAVYVATAPLAVTRRVLAVPAPHLHR